MDRIEIVLEKENKEVKIDVLEEKMKEVYPELENLEITPSVKEQNLKSKGFYGYNEIKVKPVTSDIDSNIAPENIKKGTSILGVEGECKGEVETNVFMQETEPVKKDGIWLKGNYEVENIIADTNIFTAGEYNASKSVELSAIPYKHTLGSASSVGTDIYLIGSSTSSYTDKIYKYDTVNNTFTKMSATIYPAPSNASIAVGTDIYIFGSSNSSYYKQAYKYDTLTNTTTTIASIPTNFYGGCLENIGRDIYIFGGDASTAYRKYAYRYNTVSNTYIELKTIPFSFPYGGSAVIGTDIYLFGGSSATTTAYKYNTLTNSYTQLSDIPYSFSYGCAKSIGTDIYLFGGTSSKKIVYKYDTLTDTYTQQINLEYYFSEGSLGFTDTDIYLFGGKNYPTTVQAVTMKPKEFPNKSILIAQDGSIRHSTNLADVGISNLKTFYDRVYYRDDNGQLLNSIPTYNGNGTSWTRI